MGRVVVVLSITRTRTPPHTHTTAGTWTRATHTTHTCHTSQWASIPHRRDAFIACWASWNGTARVNGYIKNDKIPEWDEMGVELDDGKLEFFKPPLLTMVCRVTGRRQYLGGSSWQAGLLSFASRLLRVDQQLSSYDNKLLEYEMDQSGFILS